MTCPKCGKENGTAPFCADCGAPLIPAPPTLDAVLGRQTAARIPPEYKPLSAWAYAGWQLLFAIPFVGFVLLVVMSFAPRNKNLKSFARSHWCLALIGLAVAAIAVVIAIAAGVGINELMSQLR